MSCNTYRSRTQDYHPISWYTVGATRLARATALARSLSNTNMEMFYKDFRLEISTD
jgi:hypothetical protein